MILVFYQFYQLYIKIFFTKGTDNILIYTSILNQKRENMKAKEVMEKYGISRNTLSTWVKKKWIEIEILPSGRYRYKEVKKYG